MMKNKLFYIIGLICLSIQAFAQQSFNSASPQMADEFRANGKIYVVIAVLAIVFICLIAYLISIDVKLKKIEKEVSLKKEK